MSEEKWSNKEISYSGNKKLILFNKWSNRFYNLHPEDTIETYVCDIDIDIGYLLGIDFFQKYKCVINIHNRKLNTKCMDVPLYKERDILNDMKIE